jgi:4-hydroxy-tetrahydrodipicolinate synthase
MRLQFTGLGTALITPFTRGGALDETATTQQAKRQVEAGVHFVVPCGTTGEAPTLTEAEKLRVLELVADAVDGRAMVLAGAGGYDTREVIQAIQQAERAGAHGILSVSPYYNKPSQEGLYQHYKALAESTKLPIIVYNVRGRTGSNVEPATLARLAAIPNIIGV